MRRRLSPWGSGCAVLAAHERGSQTTGSRCRHRAGGGQHGGDRRVHHQRHPDGYSRFAVAGSAHLAARRCHRALGRALLRRLGPENSRIGRRVHLSVAHASSCGGLRGRLAFAHRRLRGTPGRAGFRFRRVHEAVAASRPEPAPGRNRLDAGGVLPSLRLGVLRSAHPGRDCRGRGCSHHAFRLLRARASLPGRFSQHGRRRDMWASWGWRW